MNCFKGCVALATVALALIAGLAIAEDDPKTDRTSADGAVVPAETYRASKLIGMEVRNGQGEDLGKIEDLVMDVNSGKVRYAALSFGGFLGVGDKLFAVPMSAIKLKYSEDDPHFVLNVDKKRLENAPGFNADSWPDFANPNWGAEVDAFYGDPQARAGKTHAGMVVEAGKGKLTMSDKAGKNQHSHRIASDVSITLDGEPADLENLEAGFNVTVTTEERGGDNVVTAIDAVSAE